MNSISLTGYLGKKPEIVHFPESGNYEATLSVSTKRPGRGGVTDWHTVIVKASDTVQNLIKPYADVGMLVSLTGDLGYDQFEGNDGQKIRLAKIFVRHGSNFMMPKMSGSDKRAESEDKT